MDLTPEVISTVLAVLIVVFIILVAFLNIYLILKNGFYVPVNCWFCNKNSKVLFSLRNSFECTFCQQYNGFKKDGDYNKVIYAQYDSSQNVQVNASIKNKAHFSPVSLCGRCNNNMELKVYQLANFVPLNERNYNIEVEHFEKQLDKAYKLCVSCDKLLKHIVRKQDAWMFGRHLRGLRKGFSTANFRKTRESLTKHSKIFMCIRLMLLLIAFGVLFGARGFDMNLYQYKKYIPRYIPSYFIHWKEVQIYNMTQGATFKFIESYLHDRLKMLSVDLIPIGFTLEAILLIFGNYSKLFKANELLCWLILALIPWISVSISLMPYINVLEKMCSFYLVCNYGHHILKKKSASRKFSFKKVKTTEYNEDFTDDEEIFENKLSTRKKQNLRKNNTANVRLNSTLNTIRTNKTASTFNNFSDVFYSDSDDEFMESNNTANASSYNKDNNRYRKEKTDLTNSFNSLQLGRDIFSINKKSKIPPPLCTTQNNYLTSQQPQIISPNLFSEHNLSPNNSFLLQEPHVSPNTFSIPPFRTIEENGSVFAQTQPTLSFNMAPLNKIGNSQLLFGPNSANNSFSPTQSKLLKNTLFLTNRAQPNSLSVQGMIPQKMVSSPVNMFRPVSPSNSVMSQRQQILSPPKLNISASSFSVQNQPTLVYQSILFNDTFSRKVSVNNGSPELPNKSNLFNLNKDFPPSRTSSRASSESSGFISNNELFRTASQSTSRDQSPERITNTTNHFKVE